MGTLIQVLLATSLLFLFSECSMKWDAKQDKNVVVNEIEIDEVEPVEGGPLANGICHWKGGFLCNPGNSCDSGYYFIGASKQNSYNQWAGYAGALCWMGTRYLCCENSKVHKDPKTSCKHGTRYCPAGFEEIWYASYTKTNLCCEPGTIVP